MATSTNAIENDGIESGGSAVKKLSVAAIILVATEITAFAQQGKPVDLGKQAYEVQCAVCHGSDAKGNGLYVTSLKVAPSDLTSLSKKNGGVLPVDRIIKVIDGRTEIAAHGSRDMPIWGKRWALNAAEHYVDVPYDQEAYIRAQALSIVDYLNRIQQ
ncbi:c-type cytochrome [Bradyrhizobium sp. 14AA]